MLSEKPFDGSITDCKVGPQFCAYQKGGGMVLSGGSGNLVKAPDKALFWGLEAAILVGCRKVTKLQS